MNGKEKFIFAILIALVGGAFYFQIMTDELNLRMDELDLADKSHVDKREFLSEICKNYNVNSEEICFVGDDIFVTNLKRLKTLIILSQKLALMERILFFLMTKVTYLNLIKILNYYGKKIIIQSKKKSLIQY